MPACTAVQAPPGFPDWLRVVTAAEDPERWASANDDGRFDRLWPEYNNHGNHTPAYFGELRTRFASFQALLLDAASDEPVARGRTIPCCWDGTLGDLPEGIDAMGLRAVSDTRPPTTLCALAAEVVEGSQGAGLSGVVLRTMAWLARAHGLDGLVAPVRPSHKDRYPLTPIDRYAAWVRPDGLPLDPWLRVHARLGGRMLRTAPRSLEIVRPVASWEDWTGLVFPEDGEYVFPKGLATLEVAGAVGTYYEPNVWVQHDLDAAIGSAEAAR